MCVRVAVRVHHLLLPSSIHSTSILLPAGGVDDIKNFINLRSREGLQGQVAVQTAEVHLAGFLVAVDELIAIGASTLGMQVTTKKLGMPRRGVAHKAKGS